MYIILFNKTACSLGRSTRSIVSGKLQLVRCSRIILQYFALTVFLTHLHESCQIGYGQAFTVVVKVPAPQGGFQLRLASAPYATHSFSQGQRQLLLPMYKVLNNGQTEYSVSTAGPPNANLAPPAYYMLFPVQNDIPGTATWVQVA